MTRILLALAALSLAASSASAATPVAECSARYFAAQREGSLNGRDWDSFRRTVCDSSTDRTRSPLRRATDLGAPPAAAR